MENHLAVEPGSPVFTYHSGARVPLNGPAMQAIVSTYAPLVRRLAYQLMARLPASVHIDDVIQNGMVGLIDSATRFEEGMGAQFETYATQRIRGAMIDGLRENDWMPRALRRDMRRIESAVRALEQKHGRTPSETEVATELDITLEDFQRTLREARTSQMVHFEDFSDEGEADFFEKHLGDPHADPLNQLIEQHDQHALKHAISNLPERERLVMKLYYEEDLNLREIGDMLGVSESRVCQLHKQAVGRLRNTLVDRKGGASVAARCEVLDSRDVSAGRAQNASGAGRPLPSARLPRAQETKRPALGIRSQTMVASGAGASLPQVLLSLKKSDFFSHRRYQVVME